MNLIKKGTNYYKKAYKMGHFPSLNDVLFSKKKKVFYCGFLGDGNYGDELVYQAAIKLHSSLVLIPIKRHMPLMLKLGSHLFWQSVSGVIIGGGTLIRGNIEEDVIISKLIKNGKPFFLHGTGVAEKISDFKLWHNILSFKSFGGVRGPLSVQSLIKNLNLELPITGDAAFCLYDNDSFKSEILPKKQILINYGTHIYNPSLKAARREIELFIDECIKKGFRVSFLPFHAIDKKLGKKLQNKYPYVELLKIPNNFEEACSHYNESTFAIGERLHFNILSLLCRCPFQSINYDKKHEDFLLSCEVSFSGIEINEVSCNDLVRFFDNRENLFDWDVLNVFLKKLKNKQFIEANDFAQIIYS